MAEDVERTIRAAMTRAKNAYVRAEQSLARAERFDRLAVEGSLTLGALNAQLAERERRTAERHLTSARIHEAWASRLEGFALDPALSPGPPSVVSAVADIAHVHSAAFTLWSGGAVAALLSTDARARDAQDLEIVVGGGPSYVAASTHEPLRATADVLAGRWPEYAERAAELGVHAVSAVPISLGPSTFGSLTIFDDQFTERETDLLPLESLVGAFVDDVLSDLASHLDGPGPGLLTGDRAYLLHNAAGRVAVDEGCDVSSAIELIRARAFSESTTSIEICRRILLEGLRLGDTV